jgi:hypothetical protein
MSRVLEQAGDVFIRLKRSFGQVPSAPFRLIRILRSQCTVGSATLVCSGPCNDRRAYEGVAKEDTAGCPVNANQSRTFSLIEIVESHPCRQNGKIA